MAAPAFAFDSQFGGYWRTRAYAHKDFDGTDSGTGSFVDTRTQLFYTAVFSPDFKFVNKFEFNNFWGDNNGGDIGADGTRIWAIKNSYVDFNAGPANLKVGIQESVLARGFLFWDDASGVTMTFKGDKMTLPLYWIHASDVDLDNGYGDSPSGSSMGTSRDYYAISPVFNLTDSLNINPYILYDKEQSTKTDNVYIGADVDMKINKISLWGTLIYETGTLYDQDNNGFLVAAGGDEGLVHGQVFYASGDKDANDDKNKMFVSPRGRSYYWAEIMGYGIFDNVVSNNAPADAISNVFAANLGVTVKPMDKLTLTGDVWYAQLAQKTALSNNSKDLGTEVDLKASYMILPNLQLDLVGAYLFAGDATGDEDPIEFGTQLTFSF
jgi:hypothetical protein